MFWIIFSVAQLFSALKPDELIIFELDFLLDYYLGIFRYIFRFLCNLQWLRSISFLYYGENIGIFRIRVFSYKIDKVIYISDTWYQLFYLVNPEENQKYLDK